MSLTNLKNTIRRYYGDFDQKTLKEVYLYAKKSYQDKIRHSGNTQLSHAVAVAQILASWKMPPYLVNVGLLHDVPVDDRFGSEVKEILTNLQNIKKIKLINTNNQKFIENLRLLFLAMAKDLRVVLLLLAERLHDTLDLDSFPLSIQPTFAHETLEVFAPLAERMGMGQLKGELEDLSFPYVHPEEYQWIKKIAAPHFERAERVTSRNLAEVKAKFVEHDLAVEIHGRHKRQYSLYKKLIRPEINKDLSQIHDLIAIRIITPDRDSCYLALGIIHSYWKPVPWIGVSDFIAQPKPNGYRSIHTKVFDKHGHIIEVQIRSQEMHEQAEFGEAAHYLYSQAKYHGATQENLNKGTAFPINKKIAWVKNLSFDLLKQDVLNSRIYVFSPKGDVYDLPIGATPIDFAFTVHSDLAYHLSGAKVNEKIVPINIPLKSGDVVEIIKSKSKRIPPRDWLTMVKTSKARHDISKLLKS